MGEAFWARPEPRGDADRHAASGDRY
jgi:hypothetical protein